MRIWDVSLFGVLSLFPVILVSQAQDPKPLQQAASRAYVKHDGRTEYVTANTTFAYVSRFDALRQRPYVILLKVLTKSEWSPEAEGIRGHVLVQASSIKEGHQGRKLWTLSGHGSDSNIANADLYRVTSPPCCSAMWVNEYFSLTSGRHLYTTNEDPYSPIKGDLQGGLDTVRVDNLKEDRYVGFGASYYHGNEKPTLQYGTADKVMQQFELRGHDYGDNFDVPELELVDDERKPVYWQTSTATFTIHLSFTGAEEAAAELWVPVVNDIVRPELAKLPKGYSLVPVVF